MANIVNAYRFVDCFKGDFIELYAFSYNPI